MTTDVSGFGFQIDLQASKTFPQGLHLTQFADDADPFDTPAIAMADKAMGLNGDLIVWSKATPIDVTISIIPGSDDDKNLSILAEANRVGKGKASARDVIGLTGIFPAGTNLTFTNGRLITAPIGSSIASSGKQKTKAYTFTFENKTGAPA